MPTTLATAKAIARALRAARRAGQVPEAIVLSPELHERLKGASFGYFVWSTPDLDALFGVPVEVDANAEGWAVRVS